MRYLIILIFLYVFAVPGTAQETGQQDQQFTIDTPASLDFKKEEDPVSNKKKKKRN